VLSSGERKKAAALLRKKINGTKFKDEIAALVAEMES
jgi:hypothetical protein